jgi:hypothetical protein
MGSEAGSAEAQQFEEQVGSSATAAESTSQAQSSMTKDSMQRQYFTAGNFSATTIIITQNRKIPVSVLATSLIRGLHYSIYSSGCQIIGVCREI